MTYLDFHVQCLLFYTEFYSTPPEEVRMGNDKSGDLPQCTRMPPPAEPVVTVYLVTIFLGVLIAGVVKYFS